MTVANDIFFCISEKYTYEMLGMFMIFPTLLLHIFAASVDF